MINVTNDTLVDALSYGALIAELRIAFTKTYNFPKRHHHQYPNPKEGPESTLLLMPAWDDGHHLGVKVVNVSPNNSKYQIPTIQGIYLLFDVQTGTLKAQMDAKVLTNKRTAAASALASSFLSREDSKTMLMIGTGALSTELIRAHATVRPLEQVYVWGRSMDKAQLIADQLANEAFDIRPIQHISDQISAVDIVSCATLSATPLVLGKDLAPGQHYDLVGAYKPDMREADDAFIQAVSIYVDTYEGASTETGDLAIPLREQLITMDDLQSDLFSLCQQKKSGRTDSNQITCFKSVGHALEDLAAASLVYQSLSITQKP